MNATCTSCPPSVSFRKACAGDAEAISRLVNSAYRGDSSRAGWTTETELIDGARTNPQEIRALIEGEDSLILLCLMGDDMVGSVYLERRAAAGYLGLLVVNPQLQGAGIGKQLMAAAETLVRTEWGSAKMTMTVISVREELIAFYERRGYRRTGEKHPFPARIGASVPKVQGLQFEVLEKSLSGRSHRSLPQGSDHAVGSKRDFGRSLDFASARVGRVVPNAPSGHHQPTATH